MTHRWVVFILTLAFAGPIAAPLVARAAAGCAHCEGAARCCCAPARQTGGCVLARACGSSSREEGVPAPQVLEKGLPVSSVTPGVPPAPPEPSRIDDFSEPAGPAAVPPDPPPRISS